MHTIDASILRLFICPDCGADLELGAERLPTLQCTSCENHYAIIDGIPDLTPQNKCPEPVVYRAHTLSNVIAGIYDVAAPIVSLTTWKCSPLRYMDVTSTSLGRGNHGVFVAAPVGTGRLIEEALAPYHQLTIIGVDSSWEMLRQAQKRFQNHPQVQIQLVHCDLPTIPLRENSADSVQSLNGLNATVNRIEMLNSFSRIGKPGAHISGSALVRGIEFTADFALNQFEKWGIVPILRTSEFLLKEMEFSQLKDVRFTTFGAALFWNATTQKKEST